MNEIPALAHGAGSVAMDGIEAICDRLAFVGFPSKRVSKQITGSAEDALRGIATLVEQMVAGAIEKRTAADFKVLCGETIANYARLMFSAGSLIRAVVPANVRDRVAAEALSEMEADFRDHALAAFGSSIRDQAIFTVWTLRKISDIAQQISNKVVPEDLATRGRSGCFSGGERSASYLNFAESVRLGDGRHSALWRKVRSPLSRQPWLRPEPQK